MKSILLFLFMLPLFAFSQDIYGAFTPRIEYESSKMVDGDINDFLRSYNQYYGQNMAQPFDTIAVNAFSHPAFGAGGRMLFGESVGFTTGFFMTYGKKSLSRSAVYVNGITTQADFQARDLNAQIDLGIHIWQVLFLQANMTGRFRHMGLDLAYIYQDGTYSLGNEYELLGVFDALVTTIDFGVSAALKLGKIYIPVGISFPSNMLSDGGAITFTDFDNTKFRWPDIPRDFAVWADDPANIDLDNGFVRAESFNSVRINFGIEIWLGN